MAETVSALATRLGTRLGYKRTTATEASRLQAAVISAIHQMLAGGAPGIAHEVLSGETFGTLAVTVTHAAGASTGTTAEALTNVLPGDFLRGVDGEDYTLYGVTFAGSVLNFGAPIAASLTGAGTIYRRGIILPSGGQVTRVTLEDRHDLISRESAAHMKPHETGVPELYEQRWDSTGERSVLLLYPASSSKERVLISQSKDLGALTGASSIPWRDVALDAALRDAHQLWLTWSAGQNPVEAQLAGIASAEGEAGRDNSSSGGPIING
jgi:hypothetical protein